MKLGRPRFLGSPGREHGEPQRIGVLVANLGSPAAPTAAALRPYLRQFLSDPRVIEIPRWLWSVILNLVIVPFRSPKSAAAYREVWTDEGAPLLAISRRQLAALQQACADLPLDMELGMSYGEPSIAAGLRALRERGCAAVLVLPLYPQYAASTVGAAYDAAAREIATWRWVPQLRFVSGYCHLPGYVETLAASIKAHRDEHGAPDLTLFSFHGTQLAALEAGDPYHCQCHRTARETAEAVGLADGEWMVAFQSRFGNDPWLQPYTIEMMERLPGLGRKDIHVVCPAFSADCLETLEEICGENKEAFLAAGGEKFSYVPALNDSPAHIDFLAQLVRDNVGDWVEATARENDPARLESQRERAAQTGPLTRGERKWGAD